MMKHEQYFVYVFVFDLNSIVYIFYHNHKYMNDIEKKDKISAARGLLSMFPATIKDTKTTKNGFKYSDGWIVIQFKEYHLTAPLPKSVPKI